MNKKWKNIIIIIVVIVLAGLAFWFYGPKNNDNKGSKFIDLSHVYVLTDFPKNTLDEESTNRSLQKLNTDYDILRQNLDYDEYDVWVDIGIIKLGLNDYAGAEEAWQQAISLNADRSLAYANLANLYKDFIKDYEKAIEYYDLAITKDNVGYFQDYQSFAELYVYYLPEDVNKVEAIILSGADKSSDINKVPFYYYLYNYFKGKDQTKVDYYKQKVLDSDPSFDFSLYQ